MVVPRPVSSVAASGAPFVLTAGARISIAGAGADAVARLLRDGLSADGAPELEIVREPPAFGDVAVVVADHEGPEDHRAEGYVLEVTAEGVRIGAATEAGAFWGVQTLRQLARPGAGESAGAPGIAPVRIVDHPRFGYRGALLDVARHFFTPAEVRRFIDGIALLKVNHLHLHLTDDQGWRLEILSRPRLTEIGGSTGCDGSRGGFFSQQEFRDLVAYAAERHITIVPEIDLPGHTTAALASYPELNPDGVPPAVYTGREVGFSTLLTGHAPTERFLHDVITEVAALTPGPFLHIGGDECLSTSPEDFDAFVADTTRIVAATGKIPVGWHEIGRAPGLAPGTVGQYWDFRVPRGHAADRAQAFVRGGGRVIMSPADAAYLDIVYEEGDTIGQDWTGGPTDLGTAYRWDPARIVPGLDDAHILGVEAALWTETVPTIEDAEEMTYPRLAAVAEIGWSAVPPASRPIEEARDLNEFAARLAALAEHWDVLGTRYRRVEGVPWPEPAA
ncbi:beta-N-acetylhexosaminidase [Leifsonia sp. AG29]|uniref:beta-N-acetylhexosaminidase n=1 Tax=Leifsonia sp. AG29 TaxID=2598860 RepID=UPI00131C29A7|nr:beta-N-acetylhexosaminidase [Leifsonia sp. AG29]